MFILVYSRQNATLLEIVCRRSNVLNIVQAANVLILT